MPFSIPDAFPLRVLAKAARLSRDRGLEEAMLFLAQPGP